MSSWSVTEEQHCQCPVQSRCCSQVAKKGKPTRDDHGHKAGERQPLSFELRHANAKQPAGAARLCCQPRYPEWGLPASRRSDHIRVHRSCRIRAGAEATIRLLCRCATDLPAIRRCATRAAVRHDVRSMHVCEGLPSTGFLAVARFPWLSGGVAGPRGSQWGRLRRGIGMTLTAYQSSSRQLIGFCILRIRITELLLNSRPPHAAREARLAAGPRVRIRLPPAASLVRT